MEEFYKDALRLGCLKGFKHFSLHLRGREELLVTVHHRDSLVAGDTTDPDASNPRVWLRPEHASDSATMTRHVSAKRETRAPLDEDGSPRAKSRGGSPFAAVADETFAPGAPSKSDAQSHSTTFLVGAYAKYDRPYAWVRSGPLSGQDDAAEQDLPLDLECTKNWEEGVYRAWDVVEELVFMRVFPAPANAFEVNHFALKHVPRDDRYLLTGALVAFLRDVAADEGAAATRRRDGNGNAFDAAVTRDVEKLVRSHFADVPERLRRAYT